MKRTLAAVAVATAVLAAPATAPAAPAPDKLTRQVTALTKRVTALEKKVKTLQTQNRRLEGAVGAALTVAFCNVAVTADALQGTWTVIDQIAQPTLQRTFFGAQTAVNDPGNTCADLRVTRTPVQANIAPFSALLALLA